MSAVCEFSGVPTRTKLALVGKECVGLLRGKTFASVVCALGFIAEAETIWAGKHKKSDPKFQQAREQVVGLIQPECTKDTYFTMLMANTPVRPDGTKSLAMWMNDYNWVHWEVALKKDALVPAKPKRPTAAAKEEPSEAPAVHAFQVAHGDPVIYNKVASKDLVTRIIRELQLNGGPVECLVRAEGGLVDIDTGTRRCGFRNMPKDAVNKQRGAKGLPPIPKPAVKAVKPKAPRKPRKGKEPILETTLSIASPMDCGSTLLVPMNAQQGLVM